MAIAAAGPVVADPDAGAYLAARTAIMDYDFALSAAYLDRALIDDPQNPVLLEEALRAHFALADIDHAFALADRMIAIGIDSQTANFIAMVHAAKSTDWQRIFALLEQGQGVGPLVDGLAQAWSFVGRGRMTRAVQSFDEVIDSPGLRAFGLYHKALALASVGDFEGADAILSLPPEQGMQPTRRAALARAEILSQLGRKDEAIALLQNFAGWTSDPVFLDKIARLDSGEALRFDFVSSPVQGMAEVFFSVAAAIEGDADNDYTLLYSRAAEALDPAHSEAIILSASLLEALGRYDEATETYAKRSKDDPVYFKAELGRAAALDSAGRTDTAIEVLNALIRNSGELPDALATLGDMLRRGNDWANANAAYTRALAAYGPNDPMRWIILYTRGITSERMGNWADAEADFRAALVLQPDHPSILNYLGYSLVERREKLDEALGMIERAVAGQPDSGAIVDSLAWVLYRLGRYDEAIVHMVRAAELEPLDPIVSDHLGDVLWAVGREAEARFQWQRALSFGPEEKDAIRIRAKLAKGLDKVLEEEGAPPLAVPRDDR
jgi:tetratricopeptide (TPR) repeat protein